jgi:hypothetical protein
MNAILKAPFGDVNGANEEKEHFNFTNVINELGLKEAARLIRVAVCGYWMTTTEREDARQEAWARLPKLWAQARTHKDPARVLVWCLRRQTNAYVEVQRCGGMRASFTNDPDRKPVFVDPSSYFSPDTDQECDSGDDLVSSGGGRSALADWETPELVVSTLEYASRLTPEAQETLWKIASGKATLARRRRLARAKSRCASLADSTNGLQSTETRRTLAPPSRGL